MLPLQARPDRLSRPRLLRAASLVVRQRPSAYPRSTVMVYQLVWSAELASVCLLAHLALSCRYLVARTESRPLVAQIGPAAIPRPPTPFQVPERAMAGVRWMTLTER